MKYWRPILYSIILTILFLIPQTYASLSNSTFTSAEQVTMGNQVVLHLDASDSGQKGVIFELPSGLKVTYGDLLSIGDLYGIPGKPVSAKHSEWKRKIRFKNAFNLFARNKKNLHEAERIVATIHEEGEWVAKGVAKGKDPNVIYKKMSDEFDRRLNCITGGGCATSSWWMKPGRYLNLVYDNFDHFGENALITYQIGHKLAIEKAIDAHQQNDSKKLELAYAINAFASHFLADRFSSGHMRTPRKQLPRNLNPGIVGSILSGYMHNEENMHGLHVHNQQGKQWVAYGDRAFLNPDSAEHRRILQEVLQASADQVFAAYKTGTIPQDDINQYLPEPDEIAKAGVHDISPMFIWDKKQKRLLRRVNLNDPYDRHWTSNWWGWTTLYELRDKNGLASTDQAILALSSYSEQAIHHGLITDKDMLAYLYHSAM